MSLVNPPVPNQMTERLLPAPREFHRTPGVFGINRNLRLDVRCPDPRIERAAKRWLTGFGSAAQHPRTPAPGAPPTAGRAQTLKLCVGVDPEAIPNLDGYELIIRPDVIKLIGGTSAGCFYGLQTLAQLSSEAGGEVPCCSVIDWADGKTRGLLHDVTRGKVPKLETLKLLVDRLAGLKVNQLQLYIEHAFVFSFDIDICGADDGLTPDDVRDLCDYCHERFVELVPAVATLGHMGKILSMPKYRHLAEIEAEDTWSEMSWPQRARGLTLDCLNPESHHLMERMWTDIMDAFTGSVVNICGDEPWDLGKGRNRERLSQDGAAEAYIQYIRRIHDVCAARGRRIQAWSDVLRNHPDLLPRLPKDLMILHWGYDDDTDYDATRRFVDAGFDTYACPGTSGWKRIINALDLADRNITTFAASSRASGAKGLINTDWGEHGHFNTLGCSWHGIALGAACAWNASHPSGDAYDTRFARSFWGLEDSEIIARLRASSRFAESCETWRLLWMPLEAVRDDPSLPTMAAVEEARHHTRRLADRLDRATPSDDAIGVDLAELSMAAVFQLLLLEKVCIARSQTGTTPIDHRRTEWSQRLISASERYAALWHVRNKPSGLSDILRALQNAASDVRSIRA